MPLQGTISTAAGSPGNKDGVNAYQPLLLATITFTDGSPATATTSAVPPTILRLSTHPLNVAEGGFQYNGNDYQARLLEQNIDAVQAMSDTGIDIPPSMTLKIADADRIIWTYYESTIGFKGAELDLDLVLWDADTSNFSSDSYRKFTGTCDAPSLDEDTLIVSATSKLNMQKILLPLIPIQQRCPWIFPPDLPSRTDGLSNPDSPYYQCGYSPDVANPPAGFVPVGNIHPAGASNDATGNQLTDANGVYVQCDYTRGLPAASGSPGSGCVVRGMFSQDANGNTTGHFGGVEWDPPLWWKGVSYLQGKVISGINAPNDQRYSDYVPLIYGQVFVNGVVLNIIGDANSTRMEVLICFGNIGDGNYGAAGAATISSLQNQISSLLANGGSSQLAQAAALQTQLTELLITGTSTGGVQMVICNGVLIPYDYQQTGASAPAPKDPLFRWEYVNWGQRDSVANFDDGYSATAGVPFTGLGDPYGNLAVIEVVVPTVLANSQTIPTVQLLTIGPAVRVYGTDPTVGTEDQNNPGFYYQELGKMPASGQGNPIWTLMDLLVRANWNYDQLNIQSFIDAAAVCDVNIPYQNNAGVIGLTNNDGSMHVRYSISLAITARRTAADVISGVRNCCKAMLVPNDRTGLLQVFIKQTLADQQPGPIDGSNNGSPVSSITVVPPNQGAGAPASGYSAYDFDETSILTNEQGASTLQITQRRVADSPNSITTTFQDMDNQFVVDSMTELDPVDIGRAGQTVLGGVNVDGANSYDQLQRVFETRFAETFRGNMRGDSGGTLVFEFMTTQKVAHLQVGQICRFSHQQLNLVTQTVRVIKIQLSTDHETAKVTLQWHEDQWYLDIYGQTGQPIYSGNNKQSLNRPPFGWQPHLEEPLQWDPIFDVTNWTFGMAVVYTTAADGSSIATLNISGATPVNSFSVLQSPLIQLQGDVASIPGTGMIAGGQNVYAVVCALDNESPPKLAPPEVHPCTIAVPAGTGTPSYQVAIPVSSWPMPPAGSTLHQLAGYNVYAGLSSQFMTFQLTGSGTPTSIDIESLNTRVLGPPDQMFDHFSMRVKLQLHGGVWGDAVHEVGTNWLKFDGALWDINQWAGYDITVTGQNALQGSFTGSQPSAVIYPGSLPVWNFLVVSNTADTLFFGGTGAISNAGSALTGYAGTVTSGAGAPVASHIVILVSGDQFPADGSWNGTTIVIGGRNYIVIASSNPTQLSVNPAVPVGTWSYSYAGTYTGSTGTTLDLTNLDATRPPGFRGINPGDSIVMRALPDMTLTSATTIGDLNFVNATTPNLDGTNGTYNSLIGLTPNEGPFVIRIFAGTGAGQWRNVVSNTLNQYTVSPAFNPVPDVTSRFWVEAAAWQPAGKSQTGTGNSDPSTLFQGSIPISNYLHESIVVQVLTMDSNENPCFEQYAPIRDFFIFGAGGFTETDKVTFGLDDDTTIGPNVVGKYYNVHFAGQAFIGSISCVGPPTTQDMILDVLKSSDQGVTWASLFPSGEQADYPTTQTGLMFLSEFVTLPLSVGDLIRLDGIQSGGATGITLVVKWGVPN